MNALVDDAYVSGQEPPMLPTVYSAVASVLVGAPVMDVRPYHVHDADANAAMKKSSNSRRTSITGLCYARSY